MQETSDTYKRIVAGGDYLVETRLAVGEDGVLTDEYGDTIIFGFDDAILVDTGGPESGYGEDILISMDRPQKIYQDGPQIGCAVSQEIDITMLKPTSDIPYLARLAPYVRVKNQEEISEWLPQGVFYSDTDFTSRDSRVDTIQIHGFDGMLFAEQDYPSSTMDWPARDVDILREIAAFLGIGIDPETIILMDKGYTFPYPAGYSCREVLGYLGGAYAGSIILNESGDLRLVLLSGIPPETNLLTDEDGNVLIFGEGENEVSLLV